MTRILTLTLNPAIDRTVTLDRLVPGEVHRARAVRDDAGGKGINVASCLADWGLPVTAAGVLGAGNAAVFETLFSAKGIADRCVCVAGETRINRSNPSFRARAAVNGRDRSSSTTSTPIARPSSTLPSVDPESTYATTAPRPASDSRHRRNRSPSFLPMTTTPIASRVSESPSRFSGPACGARSPPTIDTFTPDI